MPAPDLHDTGSLLGDIHAAWYLIDARSIPPDLPDDQLVQITAGRLRDASVYLKRARQRLKEEVDPHA